MAKAGCKVDGIGEGADGCTGGVGGEEERVSITGSSSIPP
jgi:hypothetical protein